MKIEYRDAYHAWDEFRDLVSSVITTNNVRSVAEIGAGANPLLPPSVIREQGLTYQLIDYSISELEKAGPGYDKLVLDFQQPVDQLKTFDLVIAQMTLEHIRYPAVFFENVSRLLRPGGKACLFFAALTNVPMLMNRILPDSLSHALLLRAQPFRNNEKHGKFPAFYRWCFGPTTGNIKRISSTGLVIDLYRGYFGHTYYRRFPLLPRLEKMKTSYLLRHPNPWFCSYSQLVLHSPTEVK